MPDRRAARSSRFRLGRPAANAAVAVALVAAVALVVAAVVRDNDPTPTVTAVDTPLKISVVGDSYSRGLPDTVVWPALAAESTGWSVNNVSIFSAGYVATDGNGSFADQIDAAVADNPDVVFVVGGINDVGKPPELITQRAIDTLGELARRVPRAKLVVMGPIWHEIPVPEAAAVIDDSVRAAAEMLRLPYLSVVGEDWLVPEGMIQEDGIHPTEAGQRVLAQQIVASLEQTGVPFV
ncbi:SGNH/GDSL hydrolase family protein [Rhodococcoides yunnanense]|uniref:SGNH/GDSL hydrolase family protein n=1 Tax=Rhodococcoides yunnanense TaxID=278209 RepID=A0ABU4B7D4_9NOCA|nr:SGNH/GDSL hydrolase family protein [Rhodococcus yunnanensis]MDV6260064.1 SGNH/GDSL hydrolase family protein [Rhodococcus yunnanensis]